MIHSDHMAPRKWPMLEFKTLVPCWLINSGVSEWLLFNATWAIVQLYSRENKLHSMRWWWWWYLICARPTCRVRLCSASSLLQQSAGRYVPPLGHVILTPSHSVCSYSSMIRTYWSNKNQLYSLWFEATETRAHDLSHLRPYTLINCRQNMSDHCKLYTIWYTS